MQVGYVFLARYAETNSDGTVDTVGGDFDCVRAPSFPAIFPLSVVAKLTSVAPEGGDADGKLRMVLDVIGPSESSLLVEPFVAFLEPKKIPKGVSATTAGAARVIMNLGGVVFPEPGRYEVKLQFGEEPRLVEAVAVVTAEVSNA